MEVRVVMRESLENVKVGDVVIEHFKSERVVVVTKVTTKEVIVGERRYSKIDGCLIDNDDDTWSCSISVNKNRSLELLERERLVRRVVSAMNDMHVKGLTYDQAVKIKEVLGL